MQGTARDKHMKDNMCCVNMKDKTSDIYMKDTKYLQKWTCLDAKKKNKYYKEKHIIKKKNKYTYF